jgi:hypothetical protein
MMIVEKQMECRLAGETEVLGEKKKEFDLLYTAQSKLHKKPEELRVIMLGRSTAVQVVSFTACIASVADDIAKNKK